MLVQHGVRGTRISAVGPDAAALDLWPDMKLADARAMVPALQVITHDTAADGRTFAALAGAMMRYSPALYPYDDNGLVVDTTGCDHLYGGERAMAQDITRRLLHLGFTCRLAFADTVGAAIALVSHGADDLHVLPPGHGPALMDALPVEALRLEDDCIVLLKRLGLKRIGDVRKVPRAALERRFRKHKVTGAKSSTFARSLQWRLDQLSGAVAEPMPWLAEPQPFRALMPCPEPAQGLEAVETALARLLPDLCQQLTKAGQGGRRFCLTGLRADGGASHVTVSFSQPVRNPADITRLFKDRLERIDCGFGIDLFALAALAVERLVPGQYDMVAQYGALPGAASPLAPSSFEASAFDTSPFSASLAGFADIVANRTGHDAVTRFAPRASHVPERAQQWVPLTTPGVWKDWHQPVWSPRPLRLFQRPEAAEVTAELPDSPPAQFVWRRVLRRVVKARGPERILPEWWHDHLKPRRPALYRDYYDVEDNTGLRYWIFRSIREEDVEPPSVPLIANDNGVGSIENDPGEPERVLTTRWYVHGLF